MSDKGQRYRRREWTEQQGPRPENFWNVDAQPQLPRSRADTAASWFNIHVDPPEGLEHLRAVLARIVEEIRDSRRFLLDVADEVFQPYAVEQFEAAQGMPLKKATLERKERARKRRNTTWNYAGAPPPIMQRAKGTSERTRKWKRRRITGVSVHPGILSYSPGGADADTSGEMSTLFAAFAASFENGKHSNVALRYIVDDGTAAKTLLWGTKGLAGEHASEHIFGTRHMQARLAGLDFDKPDRRQAFDDDVREVMATQVYVALQKAGAPHDWIEAVTGGYGT